MMLDPQDGTNDYDDYVPKPLVFAKGPQVKFKPEKAAQKRRLLVEHDANFALPTFSFTLEELNELVLKSFPPDARVVTVQTNSFDPMLGGARATVEVTVRWTQEVDFDA